MVEFEPNKTGSAEQLTTMTLDSFGTALQRFDDFWHAGWDKPDPASERCCVAKVAADVATNFGGAIESWCEVSLGVLSRWSSLEIIPKEILKQGRGAVDLVLYDKNAHKILALVEFKNQYRYEEDQAKLKILKEKLTIPTIILVACDAVSTKTDAATENSRLREAVHAHLQAVPEGWRTMLGRRNISLSAPAGGVSWLVCPFALWRSD